LLPVQPELYTVRVEVVPRVAAEVRDAARSSFFCLWLEVVHAYRAEALSRVFGWVEITTRNISNLLDLSVYFFAFAADPLIHAVGNKGKSEPAQQGMHHIPRVENQVEVGYIELAFLIQLQDLKHCK
jgi:hypothetical protein